MESWPFSCLFSFDRLIQFFLFFQILSHLGFSTSFFCLSIFTLSIPLHLIDLFIDAPHTQCHKTFVTTEPDRQEERQTYVSHKTQHVNPTVNSDPKGNRPLGVYSFNLTHTMLWYTTKMLQYTNLKMFRITLYRDLWTLELIGKGKAYVFFNPQFHAELHSWGRRGFD